MAITKIDKKALEEPDKLQLFFLNIREFIEKHRSRIYMATGVFSAIVLLAGGWYLYQLNYETSAEKIYARILDTAMKALSPAGDPAAISGYKDLIARYPQSRAAATAYYRLGNLYFNRNEVDSAITAYRDFLSKASADSDLVTLAYSELGSCYEAKKDFNKAIESYEMAMKSRMASAFEVVTYGGIARVYEKMNNPVKAVEFYQKALAKTKDPLMTLYLKRKISLLG
ncbi:MAG: tetratricopeptide repeat protein [Syntrophales bacterium]